MDSKKRKIKLLRTRRSPSRNQPGIGHREEKPVNRNEHFVDHVISDVKEGQYGPWSWSDCTKDIDLRYIVNRLNTWYGKKSFHISRHSNDITIIMDPPSITDHFRSGWGRLIELLRKLNGDI